MVKSVPAWLRFFFSLFVVYSQFFVSQISADPHTDTKTWDECLSLLSETLPKGQISTWLKPIDFLYEPQTHQVTLFIANRFKLDWIRSQYLEKITTSLKILLDEAINVQLSIAASPQKTQTISETDIPIYQSKSIETNLTDTSILTSESPDYSPTIKNKSRLNPQLTFDTLLEGTANRMARAAGLHVASGIGERYNPFFIYGGVGLGKTHLMHAIGNRLLQSKPQAKVLYIHAEQFVSDVVRSYQRKTFDEFRNRYHQLDLLLIDDVQFFIGKDKTQEEFFNAFEALLARQSHVVLTSDTYPKGLTDISERLVSRFDAGLTVALDPPELELRVAILLNKAQQDGVSLQEDVAFFIAKNVRANVRELEGALRKVLAYAKFNQKDITIHLARESLRDLLSIQNRQVSVENIQKTVADYFKIKTSDMYSNRRFANITLPRQIAMYLAKELTKRSLPEIGDLFGGRDHTTILHAVRKITKERINNTELNQHLHVLEQTLKT